MTLRMTSRRRVLALLVALCIEMALDLLSTHSALTAGAREANPLARALLALPDAWLWLGGLKVVGCALIIGVTLAVLRVSGERLAARTLTPTLALICLVMAVIDAHNWWLSLALLARTAR